MSILGKDAGRSRRDLTAVLVASLKLVQEFQESATCLQPGRAGEGDSIDDREAASLPLDVSIIGSAGYSVSPRGQGSFKASPFLDPTEKGIPQDTGTNVPRVGWEASPLNHGLNYWPDSEFKRRLRLSRPVFNLLVHKLKEAGYVSDSKRSSTDFLVTGEFKVAVALMHLAHGGTWWETGFSAGISEETVEFYTKQVCKGIVDALRPEYMPGKPAAKQTREVKKRLKTGEEYCM